MDREGTGRTVLVVEDDADDRAAIRRLLRGRGREYTIVEAASGAEGLARCGEARPDCVLLDFHLPDMDGLAFLDALASGAPRGLPLPVAMLTGHEDDAAALAALKRGAEDYLVKDALTAAGLVRAIENAMGKFQVRQELEEQRAAVELRNHKLLTLQDELHANMLELADATRAKDRFLAVMSHEMRTPLNAILGYSDLLDLELDGPLTQGQRQHLERMRVGGRHLLNLINDVLDLTRADARMLEIDMRPVDLSAALEEVVALLDGQAAAAGLTLSIEPCATPLPHVHADLQRLRQVLTNLVGNAIKFTDRGSVVIRCAGVDAGGFVHVQVVDTGIGIDDDVLPRVFQEFYQAKNELTRRHNGSGLGLAISQRLAQLMGGEIAVASAPGKGSTFTLQLRAAHAGSDLRAEDVAQHASLMASLADAGDGGAADAEAEGAAVVAFGHDAVALAALERWVRPRVRLRWTTDAEDLVALARAEQASLVVLDFGGTGDAAWRAAQALHEETELASPAVLLLPSISDAVPDDVGETAALLNLGWVSLVPKPFTAVQLTSAVSTAVSGANVNGAADAREAGAPRSPYHVLVVDDDLDSRRVAARFLTDAHLAVREAADGESALVDMRRQRPDVVVLDLMMPVLDGFGVLATMRADPQLAGVPVVVLTAKNLTAAERQFLSRTAVRVLQKGAHRLADVAALVLRAATGARGGTEVP